MNTETGKESSTDQSETTVSGRLHKFVMRPGPGWHHLGGAVWQHDNGSKIHIGGLMVYPHNGEIIRHWEQYEIVNKLIKINGGNIKRGLMAWAMNLAVS